MDELIQKIENIFFPNRARRIQEIKERNGKFVHYTNVESACQIIKNKEFWIRDSSCMNDYKEITHGMDCLISIWKSPEVVRFKTALESVFPSIIGEIEAVFNDQFLLLERGTYIGSFSEHSEHENEYGRLSMWRAYGGENPVALVMNNEAFFSESEAFDGLFINPVEYHSVDNVKEKIIEIAENFENETSFLEELGKEHVLQLVIYVLNFIVTCSKHKGFEEEGEWRAIYCPMLLSNNLVTEDFKTINSLPQKIYKIPLENFPDHGIDDLDIPKLIDRVIIGPTRNYRIIYKTLLDDLYNAGVENPAEKVTMSDIPLRR